MNLDRAAIATIIAGSVLFLVAAFSPIARVFGTPDAAQKLAIITAAPLQWQVAQLLFALGAIVTAVGVGLLALRAATPGVTANLAASAALLAAGAALWTWHVVLRAVDPALFTSGGIPVYLFAGYTALTLAALALFGAAMLKAGMPPWTGWLPIGGVALFLVLALVMGGLPPFVHYVVLLAVAIALWRAANAAAATHGAAAPGAATPGVA
jgi:hypothetical protein